jgi:hypothetical protein
VDAMDVKRKVRGGFCVAASSTATGRGRHRIAPPAKVALQFTSTARITLSTYSCETSEALKFPRASP